jgi:phage-related protein
VCEKKYLDDYENTNKYEWAVASGLLKSQGKYDSVNANGEIGIYNPGVKDSDWILTIKVNGTTFPSGTIKVNDRYLVFSGGLAKSAGGSKDSKITFNSKTGLVEGWCADAKSGNIYNDYIVGGDFFKIPVTTTRTASGRENKEAIFTIGPEMAVPGVFDSLKYNYYYL